MPRPSTLPTLSTAARHLLAVARKDRSTARREMGALSIEEQVALVCGSPLARRSELLDLAPHPEQVIPALPPAELVFVARAIGVEDASWILEFATEEQIATCFDLDAWTGLQPDPARMRPWLMALAEAGDDAIQRAVHAVDMELLVLELKDRVQVVQKPSGDDNWVAPAGTTLDGQFYLLPRRENDDLADIHTLLRVLFQRDYWVYFRLLQAVPWELPTETQEWALRWRDGRLQDLGFPPFEEAKAIYAWLRPQQLLELPGEETTPPIGEWPFPVWIPSLPALAEGDHALFRAYAGLPLPERRSHLLAFLALANRVAVADELPLGEATTLPESLEKTATLASRGLEHLAQAHGLEGSVLIRRVPLERLFRVGFQLTRSERDARSNERGSGEADART